MQMFGVGVLELIVILVLTTIVIGPDKMPGLAADLGRWIRQTRAYARHLMGDFNEVVKELEKEAGASREDWQEIANIVRRNTGSVGQEFTRLGRDLEATQRDLAEAKEIPADKPANGASAEPVAPAATAPVEEPEELDVAVSPSPGEDPGDGEPTEEKPWYVPERASRRRPSE